MDEDIIARLRRRNYVDDRAAADALEAKDRRIAELEERHDECFRIWDNYRIDTNARIAELEAALNKYKEDELLLSRDGVHFRKAMDVVKEQFARIAELEDGLSSACEYAEKFEAALKRLHDAALDIDVNEMSSTERDWWQTELRAARAAMGEKE